MASPLRISRRELLSGVNAVAAGGVFASRLLSADGNRSGLVAYWPLDEGKGSKVRDLSGHSVGTCQNTEWALGNGAALEFVPPGSGVSMNTKANSPFNLSRAFTLAAWVCPATLDGRRMIISNGLQNAACSGYNLGFFGQQLLLIVHTPDKNNYQVTAKCPALKEETWIHLAATYDAEGKAVLFGNGQALAEMPASGPVIYRPQFAPPVVPLYLGRVAGYVDWLYEGLMREVKVYDRALSAIEIANEFRSTSSIASLRLETYAQRRAKLLTAEIKGNILDENGRPVPAFVTLEDRAGTKYGPQRLSYGNGFFAVGGEFAVKVPPGEFSLTVTRGMEYRPSEQTVAARDKAVAEVEVRLERFVNMSAMGWYGGEHHYHYRTHGQQLRQWSPVWTEAVDAARASALDFMSYKETIQNAPLTESAFLCREDTFEGRSHNNMGGHVEWVNLTESPRRDTFGFLEGKRLNALGIYDTSEHSGIPRIDDPSLTLVRDMVVAVAMEGAPIWDIVKASSTGSDATTTWLLSAWYHFLNCGFKLAAGAFTDGDLNLPSPKCLPPGFGRTYARLPRLSWNEVVNAYRNGRVFATNGPLLVMTADGKDSGEIIRLPNKAAVTVGLEAFAQSAVEQVEIVVNGQVARTMKPDQTHFRESFPLELSQTSWLAARCTAKPNRHFGCFAHTSPVYVEVGAAPMRPTDDDIRFFLAWIADYRRLLSRPEAIPPLLTSTACFPEVQEYLNRAEKVYLSLKENPRRW
jgi:hypothetical protein